MSGAGEAGTGRVLRFPRFRATQPRLRVCQALGKLALGLGEPVRGACYEVLVDVANEEG